MSYYIYTTDAFVIGGIENGESNRYMWFLTHELGVVGAVAAGARTLKSKTRYGLLSGARVTASFVRGKDVWRLTSIIPVSSSIAEKPRARVFMRLLALTKRLSPHEARMPELYNFFMSVFLFLNNTQNESTHDFSLERISALSVLSAFGYGTNNPALFRFSRYPSIDVHTLSDFSSLKKLATREINRALAESHL